MLNVVDVPYFFYSYLVVQNQLFLIKDENLLTKQIKKKFFFVELMKIHHKVINLRVMVS